MDNTEEKLQELRRRLKVLNSVIAHFERLEAARQSPTPVNNKSPRVRPYAHRRTFTVTASRRRTSPK